MNKNILMCRAWLSAALAVLFVVCNIAMPVMAEEEPDINDVSPLAEGAAASPVTQILPYQDGTSDYSGWVTQFKHFKPEGGVLAEDKAVESDYKRIRVEIPAKVQALYAEGAKTPYRLVYLSRMKLELDKSATANVQADFGMETDNTGTVRIMGLKGGWESKKIIPVYQMGAKPNDAPAEECSVEANGWVDCAAVISGVGSAATIEYYLDGKKIEASYPITLKGNRFRLYKVGASGTAYFDDAEAFAVSGDGGQALSLIEATNVAIPVNGSIELKFDYPIISSTMAGAVSINGETVEASRLSLSADRRCIKIFAPTGLYPAGTTLNISVSEALKGYAGGLGAPANATVTTEAAAPVTYGTKVEAMPYQDFTSVSEKWTHNRNMTVANGVAQASPTGTNNSFFRLNYPGEFTTAVGNGQEAYFVIRSKLSLVSAVNAGAFAEIGLEHPGSVKNATTTDRRLVQVHYNSGNPKVKLNTTNHTGNQLTEYGNATLNGWSDVAVIIHIPEAGDMAGTVSYYVDGKKAYGDCPIALADSTGIRLLVQNECTAQFDDFECYALIGGAAEFKCLGIAGQDSSEVDTESDISLTYTSDITRETFIQNGVSGIIINGQAVDESRVTIAPDGHTVTVKKPDGGWDSQTDYTVATAPWVTDILGTAVTSSEVLFHTGGNPMEAKVTWVRRNGNDISVKIRLHNSLEEDADAWLIVTNGTGLADEYMMKHAEVKTVTVRQGSSTEQEIQFTASSNEEHIRIFVWMKDSIQPLLAEPLEV